MIEDGVKMRIDLLIENEEAIGELYRDFARRFTDTAELWQQMAQEEKHHAALLRKLYVGILSGELSFRDQDFDMGALRQFVERVRSQHNRSRAGQLDRDEALRLALELEQSLAERGFLNCLEAHSDQVRETLDRLRSESEDHAGRIRALQKKG